MIDSVTKNRVAGDSVVEVMAGVLGERPVGIEELHAGMFNAAYRITTERAGAHVLKIAPPPQVTVLHYEHDILRTEVSVLRRLAADTTVPVPEVVGTSDESGMELGDAPWVLMEWRPGLGFNTLRDTLDEDTVSGIARHVGEYLREINSIKRDSFGYPGLPAEQSSSWRGTFTAMLEAILADGARLDVPLPMPYAEIRDIADRYYPALEEVIIPRLVHWDLWDGNVLVHDGAVSAIIDCERALWADPLMEVNFSDIGRSHAAFFEGYGRGPASTPGELQRRWLYDLYLALILVIETYYRRFDPNEQIGWAYPLLTDHLLTPPR